MDHNPALPTIQNRIVNILWPSTYVVRAYCLCGDALEVHTDDIKSVESKLAFFRLDHSKVGHGPCDSRLCLRARRKREKGNSK